MLPLVKAHALFVNQLVPLSLELDNYPVSKESADFKEINSQFSDRLMRKDILDDLRNHEDIYIPPPPSPPVCHLCYKNNVRERNIVMILKFTNKRTSKNCQRTSQECRKQLSHIQPNVKLNNKELSEFLIATELLAKHHAQYNIDKFKNKNVKKKTYRKWSAMEKYTVMLGTLYL